MSGSDLEQLILAAEGWVGETESSLPVFLTDELPPLLRRRITLQLLGHRQMSRPELVGPIITEHDKQLTEKHRAAPDSELDKSES